MKLSKINLKFLKIFFGIISILLAVIYFIDRFSNAGNLDFLLGRSFLALIILINSIIMFSGSFSLYNKTYKNLLRGTSIILFILGLLPLLIAYNLLGFSSYIATLTINPTFMSLVLLFNGIYFVLDYF